MQNDGPLLVASFANIFSKSICCLFVLFMVSFVVQKFTRLIRSHLFIFAFISFAFPHLPFFNKFIYLFIYLFLAALGLHCCTWAPSSRGKRGPLPIMVRGPPTVAAPPAAEHGLQARGPQ